MVNLKLKVSRQEAHNLQSFCNRSSVKIMSDDNRSDMEVEAPRAESPPAEIKSFQERLSEIPMYTMTLSQLSSIYSSLKDQNHALNKAFTTGEQYFNQVSEVAKPVVISATQTALKAAKPVVGEINDPGKISI